MNREYKYKAKLTFDRSWPHDPACLEEMVFRLTDLCSCLLYQLVDGDTITQDQADNIVNGHEQGPREWEDNEKDTNK
jgi:hypothetical protein